MQRQSWYMYTKCSVTHGQRDMLPNTTQYSNGKKMVKSRLGVIHSWMVDIHSKVPHNLKKPAT